MQIFRTAIGYSMSRTSFFPNATLNVDISPEYMGVGYVIGPWIAGVMFAGGVLSWMVLLPLLSILGNYMPGPFPPVPASGSHRGHDRVSRSAYIRYTGAGAVLAAGIITLARTIPTIISRLLRAEGFVSSAAVAADRARPAADRRSRLAGARGVPRRRAADADQAAISSRRSCCWSSAFSS